MCEVVERDGAMASAAIIGCSAWADTEWSPAHGCGDSASSICASRASALCAVMPDPERLRDRSSGANIEHTSRVDTGQSRSSSETLALQNRWMSTLGPSRPATRAKSLSSAPSHYWRIRSC
jgi:hypothetical protein